jgi:hypothetical protein
VDPPEEPQADRESFRHALQTQIEGSEVVGRLFDIFDRDPCRDVVLEEEEIGERRLSALDLRGEHRLLADVAVEEVIWIRKEQGDSIEAPQSLIGTVQ